MTTFVDTSALLALLDGSQDVHADAARTWQQLLGSDEPLLTTSYVAVETFALVQRRLGVDAVRVLSSDFLPLLGVDWVDAEVHAAALGALLAAGQRGLSLVDCASFEVMRRRGIARAFAFDAGFDRVGFETVPRRPSGSRVHEKTRG